MTKTKLTITYTLVVDGDVDLSPALEAAWEAVVDLLGHLQAVDIDAEHLDDGTSPSVQEGPTNS